MKAWVTLKNKDHYAEILAENHPLGLVFVSGTIDTGTETRPLNAFMDLEKYGFDYPDFIAEITEQLEKHEDRI